MSGPQTIPRRHCPYLACGKCRARARWYRRKAWRVYGNRNHKLAGRK
jgi:hypothetical protein